METKLYGRDGMTIRAGNNDSLWCHLSSLENGYGIRVEALKSSTYMEVRIKENKIATFLFASKGEKKRINLGWWQDAEVVYSINEVIH